MSIEHPEIGEIRTSKELDKKETCRWIWYACPSCNKERWVRINRNGNPISIHCLKCSQLKRIGQKLNIKPKPINIDEIINGRKCSICGIIYPLTNRYFYIRKHNNKFRSECKICSNTRNRNYYVQHKEQSRVNGRIWRRNNKEKANNICKKYRDTHKNQRYITCITWAGNNKDKIKVINKRHRDKKRGTEKGKINHRMEVSIHETLNGTKNGKSWQQLVGYTIGDLKKHIENNFTAGMSWDEFNKGNIHIDHIIPLSAFCYNSPQDRDFRKAWSLDNLQPLWKIDNIRKSNHVDKPFQPSLPLGISERKL